MRSTTALHGTEGRHQDQGGGWARDALWLSGTDAPASGMRPAPLPEVTGPQRCDRTVRGTSLQAPSLALPQLAGAGGEAVDRGALLALKEERRKMREVNRKVLHGQPCIEADMEYWQSWRDLLDPSSSYPAVRSRKRRKRLPGTSSFQDTRLQGAYAKVTGSYHATSSCSPGTCGKQVLQALVAALVATSVSVCVLPEYWNDFTAGYTSDRHPGEQSFLGLRLLVDFVLFSPVKQYVPRSSWSYMRWSVLSRVRSLRILLGVLFLAL